MISIIASSIVALRSVSTYAVLSRCTLRSTFIFKGNVVVTLSPILNVEVPNVFIGLK